jgi:GTP-binding protein
MIPPPPPFGQGSRVRVVRLEDAATATTTKSSDATAEGKAGAAVMVPEVALLGRCNVGKSTLLNALLYGNKRNPGLSKGPDKAAMSSKPGETKDVTVYQLTKPAASSSSSSSSAANPNRQKPRDPLPHSSLVRLRLVDLPGYGFAHGSASTATSDQQQPSPPARHHRLVQEYLFGLHNSRKTLKRILLLVDARHGLKRADAEFLLGLQQPRGNGGSGGGGGARDLPAPVQIVLTKCDLVPQAHLARRASLVRQDLTECLRREPPGSNLPVMFVSARSVLHQNLRGRGGGRKDGAPWVLSQASSSGVLELQRQLAALALLHP